MMSVIYDMTLLAFYAGQDWRACVLLQAQASYSPVRLSPEPTSSELR